MSLDLAEIGALIRNARKQAGLTQAQLAEKGGVTRQTILHLENGLVPELGFVKLSRILTVLGLGFRLDAMIGRRPTMDDLLEENRRNENQGLERQSSIRHS